MPRRHNEDPRANAPSQRQLRVGEVIRHALAEIFARGDLQDPALRTTRLTVTEVRVSPDMRHASVYVMRLGGGEMKEVLEALARARGYLRHEVGHALTTRNTPDLAFIEDKTFDEADHISKILHSEAVRHDLEQHQEDEDGTPKKG
jgi:ribosome-binding factor A